MTASVFQPLENRGFTLIELVVALAVAVLLVSAVASGVGRALADERSARVRAEAGLLARTLACREALGRTETDPKDTPVPPGWRLARVEARLGEGVTARVWRTWTFAPESDPTFRFHASFLMSAAKPDSGG